MLLVINRFRREFNLSFLYLVLLVGVGVVLLGALLEGVAAVSRKPSWHSRRPALTVVPTVNSRTMDLPFVGTDRRGGPDTQSRNDGERNAA
jgi:hypothetical protein